MFTDFLHEGFLEKDLVGAPVIVFLKEISEPFKTSVL